MKVAVVCVAVLAVALAAPAEDTYTTRFDHIDVKEILHNDRLLNNYANCLLDRGRCTAEGTELKKTLPDALETGCVKCSPKQREFAEEAIKFLSTNKKELWDQLIAKYDPEGKYRTRFEAQAKQAGIKV